MNVYHRKLYAFLRAIEKIDWLKVDLNYIYNNLACLQPYLADLQKWWESQNGEQAVRISSSSDRVSLNYVLNQGNEEHIFICHTIRDFQRINYPKKLIFGQLLNNDYHYLGGRKRLPLSSPFV
ncbi:hypothetical protein H6G36_24330, partial [Anabaena minutissima FACHB-250]|nr:hypothetical protein [Anabaena minutissima FACHB-250]